MSSSRKGIGGPNTPEGKRRVSLNALKHGLTARSPQAIEALAAELHTSFDSLLADLRGHYRPRDPLEHRLVHRIARCLWRLMLSESMEERVIARCGMPHPSGGYDRILKYERLVDIHLHRAIATLDHKRESENSQNRPNKLPPGSA